MNIVVEVTVKDETKLITYESWHAYGYTAKLRDNFGNKYLPINFGIDKPVGRIGTTSVRAGEPAFDMLVFDPPLTKAEYVDLDLPGENLGLKANGGEDEPVFRFRLSVKKPEPEPDVKAEKKPELVPVPKVERPVEPALPKINLTPPEGTSILLGESLQLVTDATKSDQQQDVWVKKGTVKSLSVATQAELVTHEKENGLIRVRVGGREWVTEDKWLSERPLLSVTLTPASRESIILGTAQYLITVSKKDPAQRDKWVQTGSVKVLTDETEVELIVRDKEFSKVLFGKKEWMVETRWLKQEKK